MFDPSCVCVSDLPSVSLINRLQLPTSPCIYFAVDCQWRIQYIGRSINPQQRWLDHHRCDQLLKMESVRIAYLLADVDSLEPMERSLIDYFQPPLNRSPVVMENRNRGRKIMLTMDADVYDLLEQWAELKCIAISSFAKSILEIQVLEAEKRGECGHAGADDYNSYVRAIAGTGSIQPAALKRIANSLGVEVASLENALPK
jgi:hypothetical protein